MSKVRIARIKWNSAANDREFALDLLPELDGGLSMAAGKRGLVLEGILARLHGPGWQPLRS